MMPGVLRFPAEISILKKEVFNNWYKLRTYYVASLITSTPIHVRKKIQKTFSLAVCGELFFLSFQMLYATIYASTVFFITEQPQNTETYLQVVTIYILLTICADGFGILLGTLVNPIVKE